MSNQTISNMTQELQNFQFSLPKFVAKQVLWTILTMVSLYLFVVLILFETRRKPVSESTPFRRRHSTTRSRSTVASSTPTSRRTVWLNIFGENPMCILTMTSVLLRCVLLQVEFNFGSRYRIVCEIFSIMNTLLGAAGYFGVYVLLWTRQWGLYNSKPLKPLFTRRTRCISIAVMVSMVIGMFAVGTLFILTFNVIVLTPEGCIFQNALSTKRITTVTVSCMVTAAVLIQASLLGLTIYPLSKQYDTFWCCCQKKTDQSGASSSLKRVRKVIRRISISCGVCMFCDIAVGAAIGLNTWMVGSRTSMLLMFYSIGVTVNTVAVIGSFNDWKDRLLPMSHRSSAASGQTVRSYASDAATNSRATADTPIRTPQNHATNKVVMPTNDSLVVLEVQASHPGSSGAEK